MENIDSLIINRLGEHQRKVDFINRNINGRSETFFSFKKVSYTALSVAACLAIVFVVSPMLFTNNDISNIAVTVPSFSDYRGTSFYNIESLISSGRYEDALSAVSLELTAVEKELQEISSTEMGDDEESYIIALYNVEKEELMWSKIYLLVKLNRKDDLKHACQNYLNNSNFVKYKSEVEKIFKKFQ